MRDRLGYGEAPCADEEASDENGVEAVDLGEEGTYRPLAPRGKVSVDDALEKVSRPAAATSGSGAAADLGKASEILEGDQVEWEVKSNRAEKAQAVANQRNGFRSATKDSAKRDKTFSGVPRGKRRSKLHALKAQIVFPNEDDLKLGKVPFDVCIVRKNKRFGEVAVIPGQPDIQRKSQSEWTVELANLKEKKESLARILNALRMLEGCVEILDTMEDLSRPKGYCIIRVRFLTRTHASKAERVIRRWKHVKRKMCVTMWQD
ncbi:hypothetical protein FVE85_1785 [Porphyridium purpureum]|uniref:Uncharacterized protein n=1 Tax=Porphyridium purpureum TaxID=35688 RepID=A0A5J4YXD2_PORPP|nr:hypothetical protein FVE85_1785 [Porphyridium purpureum]|eukprot:POR9427..scf209_3